MRIKLLTARVLILVLVAALCLAGVAAFAAPTTNPADPGAAGQEVKTDPVKPAGPAAAPEKKVVAPAFKDVAQDDPNLVFINYLFGRGLVKGFTDGTYHSAEGLTRGEAAVLLVKAAGLAQGDGKTNFSDVEGHWAAGSISAAVAAGMLSGYPDGTFGPDARITRAEGITLFLRLSRQKDPGVALPAIDDLDSGHWAARPVAVGLASKMVGLSKDKKNFLPDDPLTRGQMARILGILLTKDPDLSKVALTGRVKVIKGTVTVTPKGEEEPQAVKESKGIIAGDNIKTGPGSSADITFPDGTSLRLEEDAELTIREARGLSYIVSDGKPGVAVDWLDLDLKQGKMFGALAKQTQTAKKEEPAKSATTGLNKYPALAGNGLLGFGEAVRSLAYGEAGGAGGEDQA
ncbi:MAG: S-layer homology domain-containing protein, partial [Desulfocucumaceae bacterium]